MSLLHASPYYEWGNSLLCLLVFERSMLRVVIFFFHQLGQKPRRAYLEQSASKTISLSGSHCAIAGFDIKMDFNFSKAGFSSFPLFQLASFFVRFVNGVAMSEKLASLRNDLTAFADVGGFHSSMVLIFLRSSVIPSPAFIINLKLFTSRHRKSYFSISKNNPASLSLVKMLLTLFQ